MIDERLDTMQEVRESVRDILTDEQAKDLRRLAFRRGFGGGKGRHHGPFAKLGVHRPLELDESRADDVRWVNGAGRVMPERVVHKAEWFSRKDTIGYDMVTLNHYVLRSAESFLVKRQRGRINHVDQDQGLAYWVNRNYATETDTSIHAHLPRAREALSRLLADEKLFQLHLDAVAWHQDRIATLMAEPDYRALYAAITNPGLPDAIWRAPKPTSNQAPSEEGATPREVSTG